MTERKTFYVAYTNTDLTEGRGYDIPIATCELEVTAIRLGRGRYVQGSDSPVRSVELINIDGKWYVPQDAVRIYPPTDEDREEQKRLEHRRDLLKRAKAAGFTDEDIKALINE